MPFNETYSYDCVAPMGRGFAPEFTPFYTPKEMLALGVFEGHYLNSAHKEYPDDWFQNAKISSHPNASLNYFGVKSRQPLSTWKDKGWIYGPDKRGWFEWYCRYFLGRRLPEIDTIQIKRWRAFRRHVGQVKKNCNPGNAFCRPKQRQALLQWSHNCLC